MNVQIDDELTRDDLLTITIVENQTIINNNHNSNDDKDDDHNVQSEIDNNGGISKDTKLTDNHKIIVLSNENIILKNDDIINIVDGIGNGDDCHNIIDTNLNNCCVGDDDDGGGGGGNVVDNAAIVEVVADAAAVINGCAGDGNSDSGVEIGTANCCNNNDLIIFKNNSEINLQRALSSSNNSGVGGGSGGGGGGGGGYTSSSCGGFDEPIGDYVSCNSSMISFCSEIGDNNNNNHNNNNQKHNSMHNNNNNNKNNMINNDYCTSEGNSESSSIVGGPTISSSSFRRNNISSASTRKKVILNDSSLLINDKIMNNKNSLGKSIKNRYENTVAKSRSRAASANRAAVSVNPSSKSSISPTPSSSSSATVAATRERNSRIDGSPSSIQNSNKITSIVQSRSTPIKKLNKPDSLPTGLKDGVTQSIPSNAVATNITRNQLNRTPSLTRNNRTSSGCTPTKSLDDGRWPLTKTNNSNVLKSQRSIGSGGGGGVANSISNINLNNNNNNQRFINDAIMPHENLIIKTKIGPISLDNNNYNNYNDDKSITNIIDKYATLPRRRKEKSAEDLNSNASKSIRSNSASRDRMTMTTSFGKGSPVNNSNNQNNYTSNLNITKEQIHPSTRQQQIHPFSSSSSSSTMTRNQKKNLPKIKLYRETSSQTLITRKDVDDAFAGNARPIDINAIEMATKASQVDIRDKQMESLEMKLKKSNEHNSHLQNELTKHSQIIMNIEQQLNRERDEKQAMHFELQKNTQRILGLLELTNVQTPSSSSTSSAVASASVSMIPSNNVNPAVVNKNNHNNNNNNNNNSGSRNSINSATGGGAVNGEEQILLPSLSETNCDSLLMLESQIQLSGHVLEEKQSEIEMLHSFCRKLQIEMKRSLSVQQNLLEEKEVIEKESTELQDFLQDEKTALVDALKEIELENEENKEKIEKHTSDLERLREECRHLVRISEQRRHEYLGIQSKYNALESRSKELIVQQGTAVSGASKALAGLGARLDKLVEQLISSYNISEQELEDVIYHNEAYTTNSSSGDGSPDYDMMGDPNNHHQQQQHKLFKNSDSEQMDGVRGGGGGDDVGGSLSPQRHQSFIVAVINAIKNAAVGSSMKYSMHNTVTNRKDIDYLRGTGNVDLLNGNNQYNNNNELINNNGNISSVCANNNNNNIQNNNNHQLQNKPSCDDSDSTDMLDSETEPCLMMENVLEDVQMPDTHSHNMVSSTCLLLKSNQTTTNRDQQQQQQQSQLLPINVNQDQQSLILNDRSPDDMDKNEESINNLSQAIVNRQQIELHNSLMIRHNSEHSTSDDISVHESQSDIPSISEYCSAQALVNEVIDVDNLVTKLLKVLRIIQMDNDNCIQQLISDKNKLQLNKAEIIEKLKDYEMLHLQLKNDLQDSTHQLMVRGTDLANCKIELQRHRSEIDRLNVDVCNLSTLCTENKNNNINNNSSIKSKEDIFSTLKSWHENGLIDERELISRLLSTCKDEIPILKQNLSEKEHLLNENDCNKNKQNSKKNLTLLSTNWKNAMVETKRQYEAIDKALEILNNMQSIVSRYPELIDLQRQLEETNFNSITNLPLYSAILSASNNNINEDDDNNNNNNNNNNNENNIITNLSDCGDENDATPLNGNIGGIKGNKNGTTINKHDMACQ